MSLESYTEPVSQLLTCDVRLTYRDWFDYPRQLGLTQSDVPELIRMAIDPQFNELDSDSQEVWAPIHAIRALGQLRAEEAIAPLISLFTVEDDYFREDLPDVLGLIGPAAIAPLAAFLEDTEQDVWARVLAVNSLEQIVHRHPDHRSDCVEVMMTWLARYRENDEILDSTLIDCLTQLKAQEAAPLIEEVFAHKDVDEMLTGSPAMVRVQLGLNQESDFSPEELKPKIPESMKQIKKMLELFDREATPPQGFGKASPPQTQKTKKSKKKKKKR
ncbi:MAG: HEAT repeat domain-containing protein [Elainellaceae cyanobacterium]